MQESKANHSVSLRQIQGKGMILVRTVLRFMNIMCFCIKAPTLHLLFSIAKADLDVRAYF